MCVVWNLVCTWQVSQAFNDVGSPVEPLLTPDGALRELLLTTSVYAEDRLDVKPDDQDLVSWPPVGSTPCDLALGLPDADCTMFAEWNTRVLKPVPESSSDSFVEPNTCTDTFKSTKKAYCDPALFHSASVYADFLRRLDAGGMIHWSPARGRREVLGVFFVAKKNGSLRLIFDTRVLNHDFQEPAHTSLPSFAAFSNTELPEGKEFALDLSISKTHSMYLLSFST